MRVCPWMLPWENAGNARPREYLPYEETREQDTAPLVPRDLSGQRGGRGAGGAQPRGGFRPRTPGGKHCPQPTGRQLAVPSVTSLAWAAPSEWLSLRPTGSPCRTQSGQYSTLPALDLLPVAAPRATNSRVDPASVGSPLLHRSPATASLLPTSCRTRPEVPAIPAQHTFQALSCPWFPVTTPARGTPTGRAPSSMCRTHRTRRVQAPPDSGTRNQASIFLSSSMFYAKAWHLH